MEEGKPKSDWIKLLAGELPAEDQSPLVHRGVKELHAFLESHSRAEDRVLEILGRRLSGQPKADTWPIMHDSLRQYLGEDLAFMLYWVVRVENPQANRMQELPKETPADVMGFLGTVVGIYGEDLSDAYAVLNREPENWRTISREIHYDQLKGEYCVRVHILKYNGEKMVIQGPPDSILALCTTLIVTVRMIGTPGIPAGFSKHIIDDYLGQSRQLAEGLSPEQPEQREGSAE